MAHAWTLLAAASLGQCGRARAAVLVRVETDLTAGPTGEVRALRVRIGSGSGVTSGWRHDTVYPLGRTGPQSYALPFRVAVLPLGDDAARVVTVDVSACTTTSCVDPADAVVQQRAVFAFVEGEQRELLMLLSDVCRNVRCDNPLQTCRGRARGCEDARVDVSQLPAVGAPSRDAGPLRPGDAPAPDADTCEVFGCSAGERCCQRVCLNVRDDARNCGGCGVACGEAQTCDVGRCVCRGNDVCGGRCVYTGGDPANCGACGAVCGRGQICDGRCACSTLAGILPCGADCVRAFDDPTNCGGCGARCPEPDSCRNGACVKGCPPGESVCHGRCVTLDADANHCGRCDHDCGVGAECASGACRPAAGAAARSCATPVIGCGTERVDGATIVMGDDAEGSARPVQPSVAVDTFVMDRYEVTVARFRRYWESGHTGVPGRQVRYPDGMLDVSEEVAAPFPAAERNRCTWSPTPSDHEGHPINCVGTGTAQAFCVWDGGRLPTEAEWELAARGMPGDIRSWDSTTDATACTNQPSGTCAETDASFLVGTTASGIWHMIGNVSEMTADRMTGYADPACWGGAMRRNPLCRAPNGPPGATVARGYAWRSYGSRRSPEAYRSAIAPLPSESVGFRCARAP